MYKKNSSINILGVEAEKIPATTPRQMPRVESVPMASVCGIANILNSFNGRKKRIQNGSI